MPSKWVKQWWVKFNLLKTETVIFTLNNIEVYTQLIFDDSLIKFADDHKHLGITFSSNGKCHTHIKNQLKFYSSWLNSNTLSAEMH